MVQILINDWPFSMGATALLRMDKDNQIVTRGNVLDVPIEWIETLPERLFSYLIQTYSIANRREKQLLSAFERIQKFIKGEEVIDKDNYKFQGDYIYKTSKDVLDKVIKYFPHYKEEVTLLLLTLKEAIKDVQTLVIQDTIARALDILKEKEVDQKLTLNIVKATILASSGGQVSFLNVAKNTLTYKEQVATFRKDFVDPLLFELRLQESIQQGNPESTWKLMQENEHEIVKQWKKQHKKATVVDLAYFEQLANCSALAGQWGLLPYEEKMFMPLASTSLNDFRDGQLANAPLISTLARLLLFLAPLGCSSYRKKIGREEQFVFSFLHVEGDCWETKVRNTAFLQALKQDNLFSSALVTSHDKIAKLELERKQVTILIEWVTFSQAKKTLLEYRVIHEKFIELLLKNRDFDLSKLRPFDFREQLVQQALRNQDLKMIIMEELRRLITENYKNKTAIKMALNMREVLLREGTIVEEKSLTDRMYGRGQSILYKYTGKSQQNKNDQEATDVYKAPSDKKMATIAYRLLNAAKGGNRELFFETVLRLHVLTGKSISKEFTSMLDRQMINDHTFATMALAFIAGLTSSYETKEEKGEAQV